MTATWFEISGKGFHHTIPVLLVRYISSNEILFKLPLKVTNHAQIENWESFVKKGTVHEKLKTMH